jgi:hypothetical protein
MEKAVLQSIKERAYTILDWRRTEEPPTAEVLECQNKLPIDVLALFMHIDAQAKQLATVETLLADTDPADLIYASKQVEALETQLAALDAQVAEAAGRAERAEYERDQWMQEARAHAQRAGYCEGTCGICNGECAPKPVNQASYLLAGMCRCTVAPKDYHPDDVFCRVCGLPFEPQAPPSEPQPVGQVAGVLVGQEGTVTPNTPDNG